jgi:hypothetical protein
VSSQQGEAMARQINAHKYVECSAKTKHNVREVCQSIDKGLRRVDLDLFIH